ncbi:MAG: alpha/beta fold hydrolase [Leptolyngbya sp. SIO4C1]|nr:alpha/beta fold hydrolase [Leptolyngbya sp. SIO4C1]
MNIMTVATPAIAGSYWAWQGFQIYYVRAGEPRANRPPLLLVHGFGASTDHWRKNIAELQADFEVWAVDLLGFGRSSKPTSGYSSALWRDQLHDFIAQVIGRPTMLAGNSIGGYACLFTAATRPESAAGAVLLNGVGAFSTAVPATEPNSFQKAVGSLIRDIVLSPIPSWFIFQFVRQKSYIRKTLEQVYVNKAAVTDELVEAIYRPATEPSAPAAFAALFKAERGEPVDTLLAQLNQPLLLLWGEADPWMNCRQRSQLFRAHYSNLEEHFLNAGHCPHDDRPELVNPLIREWVLAKVS